MHLREYPGRSYSAVSPSCLTRQMWQGPTPCFASEVSPCKFKVLPTLWKCPDLKYRNAARANLREVEGGGEFSWFAVICPAAIDRKWLRTCQSQRKFLVELVGTAFLHTFVEDCSLMLQACKHGSAPPRSWQHFSSSGCYEIPAFLRLMHALLPSERCGRELKL